MKKAIEILEQKKEELKQNEFWKEYNQVKKSINQLKEIEQKEEQKEEQKKEAQKVKRITIYTRNILERGKKGYFNPKKEKEIFYNLTDKKVNEKLEELNKNKKTRLFKIEYDFKLTTKKGKKEYFKYLIDNENYQELKKYL